jgi:Ni/Co efflux regulator RcnB
MKMLFSSLAAMVLSASFALPLNATPIVVPNAVHMHTLDVEQVKHRRHGNGHAYGHRKKHRYAYRDCRYYGSCYRPRYYRSRDYYGYRDHYPYRRRSGVTVYFDF